MQLCYRRPMRGGHDQRGLLLMLLGVAACTFDSSGDGVSTGLGPETSGGSTSGQSSSAPDLDATTAVDGDADAHTDETSTTAPVVDDTSTSGDPSLAVLELSDQTTLDFGGVPLEAQEKRLVTLSHVSGDMPADSLAWALGGPFSFTGNGFPGEGGDCNAALAPGDSCTLELAFVPEQPGVANGLLTMHYFDGASEQTTSLSLAGAGVGSGPNLLVNAAAQQCTANGMEPPGWELVHAGWICHCPSGNDAVAPRSGSCALYGNTASGGGGTFQMRQDVDVSGFESAFATGDFGFEFRGWGLKQNLNRRYRMDVVYLDAQGDVLASWSTGDQSHESWTEHLDRRAAPADTRTVSVRLFSNKGLSGSYTHAYFDDLELRPVYPAESP